MQTFFPVGRIVSSDDLVGRDQAINDLISRLQGGQSIMLAGPRRIGKTSVVEESLRRLRQAGYYTGRVDLLRVSSIRELAEAIADACFGNLTGTARVVRSLREWAAGRSPEVNFRAALGTEAEFALSFGMKANQRSDTELLDDALALPQQLATRANKRFVLAYDEFQELPKLDAGLLGRMRAAMILQDRVAFVFLGSQETLLHSLFTKRNEPFYRFATSWSLPPVPEGAWIEYLHRKYGNLGFNASQGSLQDLIRRTGGHPMDTMLVANEVVHLARELGTETVSLEMIAVAYERVLTNLTIAFDEAWSNLDPAAQHVLKRTAAGEGCYSKPAPHPTKVKRAIDRLLGAGVLERMAQGRYRFQEAMFGEYVRRKTL